jgi:hypothetical protein
MITTSQAIKSLDNNAEFSIRENTITWVTEPIDDAEIQTEIARLQSEYDLLAYSRSRKAEYPSIEECIHAILDDDLTALQVKRQAVKDKYPKGGN